MPPINYIIYQLSQINVSYYFEHFLDQIKVFWIQSVLRLPWTDVIRPSSLAHYLSRLWLPAFLLARFWKNVSRGDKKLLAILKSWKTVSAEDTLIFFVIWRQNIKLVLWTNVCNILLLIGAPKPKYKIFNQTMDQTCKSRYFGWKKSQKRHRILKSNSSCKWHRLHMNKKNLTGSRTMMILRSFKLCVKA